MKFAGLANPTGAIEVQDVRPRSLTGRRVVQDYVAHDLFGLLIMMLDPHALHIYTDGSCFENPGGSSGCAARAEFPDHVGREEELLFSLGYVASTNNRMEVLACIHSLRWVCESSPWRDVARIQIVTDSLYVKNGVIYARQWKKEGGSNRYGEPMENWDLWKELSARSEPSPNSSGLRAGCATKIHSSFAECTMMPKPRRSAAVPTSTAATSPAGSLVRWSRYRPGRYCAAGQLAMVRPYRKKRMKNGEWKIRFDVISEDGRSYAGSYYAYASSQLP